MDGSLHLATSPSLGKALVAGRLARPFPYQRGWVCEDVYDIGVPAAIALFRSNYERLQSAAASRSSRLGLSVRRWLGFQGAADIHGSQTDCSTISA